MFAIANFSRFSMVHPNVERNRDASDHIWHSHQLLLEYDATLRAVRFWGRDGALEASFFVNKAALKRIEPTMRHDESRLLKAFDSHRDLIYAAATKVYRR